VDDVTELIAGVGQDANRGDVVGLAGEDVAFDCDVAGAEGTGGDRGGELEQEQRPERRLGVQVGERGPADGLNGGGPRSSNSTAVLP